MPSRIIYLHGFASSPTSSKARYFVDRLAAEGVLVEVPDLAQGDFENLTLTRQLQLVEALANGQPVRIMGSSLGGYLAALYAARHPEVEKLVLLAPAFQFASRFRERLGSSQVDLWATRGHLGFYHYGDGAERPLRYCFLQDLDAYEDFPRIAQPCLILHGRHDDVVPWHLSREFIGHNPQARLVILETDHQMLDVKNRMWESIRDFLL
ncbi:MAG: alpha/beta fold hydrolase [Bryobacteraceae bacterium]|nr:alpha/beta fold hydrolase [Bryobacteraceae bacterium]